MKRYIAKALVFFFLIYSGFDVFSQNIEDLRKERELLLKDISTTSKLIQEKKESRENNLHELNLINREIESRERLINNFKKEISQLDNQIEVNQMLVNDLESDIVRLKEEYAQLIRDSYRRKGEINELMFLFSSGDFSKAYLRYRLFREYSRYRQKQGELLIESQNKINALLKEIQQQKEDKEDVLGNIEKELSYLQSNKSRKSKLVTRLLNEQQWLQKSLSDKQNAANELENRIKELIASEKKSNIDVAESSNFSDQMGKLNWPAQGIIINSFGEHPHSVLKNVTIKNNGIDIQVNGDSNVYCVHSGTISTIVAIPGLNKAVIVRHGKYLTVYGNLVDVFVTKDDIVSAGQKIGKVYRDDSEMKEVLHFEIWEENTKLDPERWLLR
jgi:murein hydrolase activator